MTRLRGYGWLLALVILVSLPALATDTLSIVIEDGAVYATSRKVDVQLTYDGEELPTQMRVFPNDQGEWSAWGDYDDSFKWTLYGDEGERTVVVETKYWMGLGWRIRSAEDTVVFDVTPPAIAATLTPDANEYGWHNGDVTIRFDATDNASGVAYVTGQTTLGVVADNESVTGYATDAAGNTSAVTVDGIYIDTVAPIVTAVIPAANAQGWYKTPVAIQFDATDELSGILLEPTDTTFSMSGAALSTTGKAIDRAGNVGLLTVDGINVDFADPVITAVVSPGSGADVWTAGPVVLDFYATDNLSGVAYVSGRATIDGVAEGFSLGGEAVDLAGNVSNITVDAINVDPDVPTTTVALANVAYDEPVDLKAKLDAFGDYDRLSVAVGARFEGVAGDLDMTLTVLGFSAGSGTYTDVVAFRACEFAAYSGMYTAVLPTERMESGATYELWFEEINGPHVLTLRVVAP